MVRGFSPVTTALCCRPARSAGQSASASAVSPTCSVAAADSFVLQDTVAVPSGRGITDTFEVAGAVVSAAAVLSWCNGETVVLPPGAVTRTRYQ